MTTPTPDTDAVLTETEQRRNRIAMWRSDLAEMAACSPEADLCPPTALLDSLEADVRADAAAETADRLAQAQAPTAPDEGLVTCPECTSTFDPNDLTDGATQAPTDAREALPGRVVRVLEAHADCALNDTQTLGSADTGMDVWSCGITLPFAEDLEGAKRLHIAAALTEAARDA